MKVDSVFLAENNQTLVKTLLKFKEMPGGFALNLRQPELIFQRFDMVINWALGKISTEFSLQREELQQAALFFIQRACFRLENNLYDTLGVDDDFTPEALRLRYRALISLTHPDKNIPGLPVDAASQINKAYDTLRESSLRAIYDATLVEKQPSKFRPNPKFHERVVTEDAPKNFIFINRLNNFNFNFKKIVLFLVPSIAILLSLALSVSESSNSLQLVDRGVESEKSSSRIPKVTNIEQSFSGNVFGVEQSRAELQVLSQKKTIESSPNVLQTADTSKTSLSSLHKNTSKNEPFVPNATNGLGQISNLNPNESNKSRSFPNQVISDVNKSVVSTKNESSALLSATVVSGISASPDSKRVNTQVNEARLLAMQLISTLERPKEAEKLQNKLIKQGVFGNLFGIALPYLRQSDVVKVEQLLLKEKLDSNQLIFSGSVTLLSVNSLNQELPLKYAVNVEFKNVENVLTVSSFDLKEIK